MVDLLDTVKVILSVASLEDKQQHLAGPRLLNRLSGEALRATEHLSVASIRSTEGWLEVLKTLDKHYKYLLETELHEAIDEFLFLLRRHGGEGATAFASRSKTQLNRLETLIAQERALTKKKRKKRSKRSRSTRGAGLASDSSSHHSSLEESELESMQDEPQDEPTDGPDEHPTGAAAASPASGHAAEQPAAFESPRAESRTRTAKEGGERGPGGWEGGVERAPSYTPVSKVALEEVGGGESEDWPEDISTSGSLGHPFLCRAPCIRAVHGTCMKGPRCEFCHQEHANPKRKLRREERQFLESMRELLALLMLQWQLERLLVTPRLRDDLRLVLAVLERRVKFLRQVQPPTPGELRQARDNQWILRGFSFGHLFTSLQHWPQVSATFKSEVKLLVDSAHRSMEMQRLG
ncbi:unnamed protein product [Cladocopium goreaui]|uniref:Copia protein n=1 Tax=Cladocopium goreaui TaxID=2562237 RepID=A0A9P1DT03_9DINO|nr:unnamed protein product [Cladocopium goreaui]